MIGNNNTFYRYPDNLEEAPMLGLWRITDAVTIFVAGIIAFVIFAYGHLILPLACVAAYAFASARWAADTQSVLEFGKTIYSYLFSPQVWEMFDSSSWFTPSKMNMEVHYHVDKNTPKKKAPEFNENISLNEAVAQSEKKKDEPQTFGQSLASHSGQIAIVVIILFGIGWILSQARMLPSSQSSGQSSRPRSSEVEKSISKQSDSEKKSSASKKADASETSQPTDSPSETDEVYSTVLPEDIYSTSPEDGSN